MKSHICPKCKGEFSRVSKSACPLCKVSLTKIEGIFILASDARIPELLLQNYELNVSRVRKETYYFPRGKIRAAQLNYAVNFLLKTKEYLSKQPASISVTTESFALMVMAEIMTDQFCRSTVSMRGLNNFIPAACSAVYQSKIAERQQASLYHSIDLSPTFDVIEL